MMFSKSCEYAIRAAVYIAGESSISNKVSIVQIAHAIDSPKHFTGKILQTLSRKKIISSLRGPHGGFYIDNDSSVFLIDIIRAIDGDELFTSCVLGLKKCSDIKTCPVHEQIQPIRNQLTIEFSKKSLNEMILDVKQNKYFLK